VALGDALFDDLCADGQQLRDEQIAALDWNGWWPVSSVAIVINQLQLTLTGFATFVSTVPVPLATVQISPTGWIATITAYAEPTGSVPGKANAPLMATGSNSPPLLSVTLVPEASPETVPLTDAVVTHVTTTLLTGSPAASSVPLPLVTSHTCPAGCVRTGDVVGASARHERGKLERAIGTQSQVVRTVVLQGDARAGIQPAQIAADAGFVVAAAGGQAQHATDADQPPSRSRSIHRAPIFGWECELSAHLSRRGT